MIIIPLLKSSVWSSNRPFTQSTSSQPSERETLGSIVEYITSAGAEYPKIA